jgi:hypothetical protein
MKYRIKANKLILGNKKNIVFDFSIRQVIEINTFLIIRLADKAGMFGNENIYCVNDEGTLIWQIEKVPHVHNNSPYTNIWEEKGNLRAYNWDGEGVTIDIKTGKIISREFMK